MVVELLAKEKQRECMANKKGWLARERREKKGARVSKPVTREHINSATPVTA
jgi:hypothetical protein